MLNLGNPELAFRTAMLPNDGVACPCGLGQSAGEPSDNAYAAIVWAMYKSMVKNFDMTIRKQSR